MPKKAPKLGGTEKDLDGQIEADLREKKKAKSAKIAKNQSPKVKKK